MPIILKESPIMTEVYVYRFEDNRYGPDGEFDIHRFKIIKETECGYWIDVKKYNASRYLYSDVEKKWISKSSKFAHIELHDAMISYKARKRRQFIILNAKINATTKHFNKISSILDTPSEYNKLVDGVENLFDNPETNFLRSLTYV